MRETDSATVETMPDFRAELASIVGRPLSAETIDTYAESALGDLAEFIQSVVDSYKGYPVIYYGDGQELEDAAFDYFGLERIEETLDHISAKAAEIRALDGTIASAALIDEVITPPDTINRVASPGRGDELEEKETIPRLKTLLFIMANDFDVDVNDRQQLSLTRGAVEDNMMRGESYYLVGAPNLGRTVLVCDEANNATFVFNDHVLKEDGVDVERLLRFSKEELRALLEKNPKAGERIIYSPEFVPNIISALIDPEASGMPDRVDADSAGRYLHPKAPEGVVSLQGLGKVLSVGTRPILIEAIEDLGKALGEIRSYKFGSRTASGFTPEQQGLIRQRLEARGYYDKAPEGFLHRYGMSQIFGVTIDSVQRAIEELGEDLGPAQSYKSPRSRNTLHYSPEQQQQIRDTLESMGAFEDRPPEGFLSIMGIAETHGLSHKTVAKVIEELGESLGTSHAYKFNTVVTTGYSPDQQELVRRHLKANGLLADEAPDGVLSLSGILDSFELGLGDKTLKTAISALGESLGEIGTYRFGPATTQGFTPDQQRLIIEYLRSNTPGEAPEGFVHAAGLSRKLGVSINPVNKIIKGLGDALGETISYSVHGRAVIHYSPEQQEMISQSLEAAGLLNNDPPEGYLPIGGVAKALGVDHGTVARAVGKLEEALGKTRRYKFKTAVTTGYSPEQQEIIKQHLRQGRSGIQGK